MEQGLHFQNVSLRTQFQKPVMRIAYTWYPPILGNSKRILMYARNGRHFLGLFKTVDHYTNGIFYLNFLQRYFEE